MKKLIIQYNIGDLLTPIKNYSVDGEMLLIKDQHYPIVSMTTNCVIIKDENNDDLEVFIDDSFELNIYDFK